MINKRYSRLFLLFNLAMFCFSASAQTTISGPQCVIPGITCQYIINGTWDNTSTLQVCVTNGRLTTTGSSCYKGKPVSLIKVAWNAEATTGAITLTSLSGNASQSIRITRPLRAGIISTSSESQVIDYNKIPVSINCSSASWGGCSPVYIYQWQLSIDRVSWVNISGAGNTSLTISAPLTQTTFFRRKVTETNSGTMGFSNVASVYVNAK